LRLIAGKDDDGSGSGEVSHFQALCTAISGTIGVGNIAHVPIAISIGGPGAAFWMAVAGFLGMSSKFVECTLGVVYREENADGSVQGGPMYYLERGLAERGWPRLGKFLGLYYAVGLVIGCMGIGSMFQSNQAFSQVFDVSGGVNGPLNDRGWIFGLVLAAIVALVIVGGIRGIARVTSVMVPFMALLYLGTAYIVIFANVTHLPEAIGMMVKGAFTAEGVSGGIFGAMMMGFRRAAFSNEAGLGSAAIAHSAVRTEQPATQGLVAMLGPLLDTVIVCTTTALVILTTRTEITEGIAGVELTSRAFGSVISWFPYVLSVVVVLFAFSTLISWSYYGLVAWQRLVGRSRRTTLIFNSVYLLSVVVGCAAQLEAIINFSDALVFAVALANIIGLYMLTPIVARELQNYLDYRDAKRPGAGS
ncbi:MAG: alanine/glycine:cation symporter family protein, partial [Acidobacteriota bacterium]